MLRGEVGCACVAREVSVERGGMGERGCARRLGGWVGVGALVSPRGCRAMGLPMAKGGVVTSFCHPERSCGRCAHSTW